MNTGIVVIIILLFLVMAGAALWWFLWRKKDETKPALVSKSMTPISDLPIPFTQLPVQTTLDDSYAMARDMRISNPVDITKAGLLAAATAPRIMPIRNEPLIGPQKQRNFIRGDLTFLPRMGGPQIPVMATLPFHESGIKCAF